MTAHGGAGSMPGHDVVVFSLTLPATARPGVRIVNDDRRDIVAALKSEGRSRRLASVPLALVAALLIATGMALNASQGGNVESQLRDLEQKLAHAWVAGDRAFIEGLLADDWTVIDPGGRILSKQQVLAETFASADRKIESMVVDEISVRRLGTAAAIVTGRTRATGSYRGQTVTVVLRFTDAFSYRSGRWQIVASQGTVIAP